jgi:hypothetical protein
MIGRAIVEMVHRVAIELKFACRRRDTILMWSFDDRT